MSVFDTNKAGILAGSVMWLMVLIVPFIWGGSLYGGSEQLLAVKHHIFRVVWNMGRYSFGVKHLSGYSLTSCSLFLFVLSVAVIGNMPFAFPWGTQLAFSTGLSGMLCMALWSSSLWLSPIKCMADLVPSGVPGGFVPFLAVVEVVSIVVRPITMGMRLLVNLSMGALLMDFVGGLAEMVVLGCWGWSLFGKFFINIMLGLLWSWEMFVSFMQAYIFCAVFDLYAEDHVR